jgi:hypothetical protein
VSFSEQDALKLAERAIALHTLQDMEGAWDAMSRAIAVRPNDPVAAFYHAQIALDSGRPAVDLFDHALRLTGGPLDVWRGRIGALVASGQRDIAAADLEALLDQHPSWIDGQKLLANLRITSGQSADYDAGFAQGCVAEPDNAALRLAWFHYVAQAKDWPRAAAILNAAPADMQAKRGFELARLFLIAERDGVDAPADLFAAVADLRDLGLDLARVRHALRHQNLDAAEAVALRHVNMPAAPMVWPYLSLIWRLKGDARAQWLDAPDAFIQTYDLGWSDADLAELAAQLRALHRASAPYLEQSVRGGTQTEGNLLLHHAPIIERVGARISELVADYVAALPPQDGPAEFRHPLLAQPRGQPIYYQGSWSVRLSAQGYHSCHTHVQGWISSALYVALPDAADMGPAPAGWLEFGTPPPELGLPLEPYTQIEPKPGRLVLFPSTMWHGTRPFTDGERLSLAFDVRAPDQGH